MLPSFGGLLGRILVPVLLVILAPWSSFPARFSSGPAAPGRASRSQDRGGGLDGCRAALLFRSMASVVVLYRAGTGRGESVVREVAEAIVEPQRISSHSSSDSRAVPAWSIARVRGDDLHVFPS